MSMPIRALLVLVLLIAWLPAEAQLLGLGFESNIELTKHDLAMIHGAVDGQVHGKPVGTAASWNNPSSGNYGTIKLVNRYTKNGLACERIEYTLATRNMPVPPEHYFLDSCLLPNGQWRIT